ncbi:MAG: helix-turn-helix domain-containing protein [Candidatus Falkowbacteria bacterium]
MPKFQSSKISFGGEAVGNQLRKTRQNKKLKLHKIAEKLNINLKHLQALENSEYYKLPTGVYGKNFLREYALFLGLNYEKISENFSEEKKVYEIKKYKKDPFSKQIIKKHYFLSMPKIVKNIIITAIIAVFFIYIGASLKNVISPPILHIYNPAENFITTEKTVLISGKTEPEAKVVVNNEQVLSNSIGEFSKTVSLKDGINIISITASKKHGRNNTVIRQILAK